MQRTMQRKPTKSRGMLINVISIAFLLKEIDGVSRRFSSLARSRAETGILSRADALVQCRPDWEGFDQLLTGRGPSGHMQARLVIKPTLVLQLCLEH